MHRPGSVVDATGLRERIRVLAAPKDKVSGECRKLLDMLRKQCPGLLPAEPLPPGEIGPEVELGVKQFGELLREAAREAGGDTLLWVDGDNELLVHASRVDVATTRGLIHVRVPVACDQARDALVQVTFAVGDAERPAGMVAATETRPRGPAVIVDVWGEALTAFAWQIVLRVSGAFAAETGTDRDGAGLVPAALAAGPDGVRLLTLARHAFDRRPR